MSGDMTPEQRFREIELRYEALQAALREEYEHQRSKLEAEFQPIREQYYRSNHATIYNELIGKLQSQAEETELLRQERNRVATEQAKENARLETERLAVIERKLQAGGFKP